MKSEHAFCLRRPLKKVYLTFTRNDCPMHAAGLTYFSLLAVIPALCCMLALAKTCHVDRYARERIDGRIDAFISGIEKGGDALPTTAWGGATLPIDNEKRRIAAGEFAREARNFSNALFERIDRFDVGTLGWIGTALLLWTVVSSLGMVEVSFNRIWTVARPRPIWKRVCTYLFIMLVVPVLAALAMTMPAIEMAARWGLHALPCGGLVRFALTYISASHLFALFFSVMPNRKVAFGPALKGGAITALMFGAWLKICAVAQVGIAASSALYGSFAVLPILLTWLYMSWQIVLLGACITRNFDAR